MQSDYKTPPAKESGKLGLSPPTWAQAQSRKNSLLPLFCQNSNVSSSYNICNNNKDEGRSLDQEFLQENLFISPDNNDNGEGNGSGSFRGNKCGNLAIASNTTFPVGSMGALISHLAELEKEKSDSNVSEMEMKRLSNEFNEQAEVLVAVLQLSLNFSSSKKNAQAVSEIDSNSDGSAVASNDIQDLITDPDEDKDKAASSNVVISSKTSGLIFQLAATELAKSKARDIGEIESLKKTFHHQAKAFISAFSGGQH